MTLRVVSPMLSLFAVPAIVGIVAVIQLVSLDGLVQKSAELPIAVQLQNAPEKLIQPVVNAEPTAMTIAVQTEQERHNTTLSQIQDGDWLTQQGKFRAAKAAYHQALNQTQNADLAATATDRLHQLSRKTTFKPVAKSILKPVVKPIVKPVVKPAIKVVIKPTAESTIKSIHQPTREYIHQPMINPIANPIANSITNPIENPIKNPTSNLITNPSLSQSTADLLSISQPTLPTAPQLEQSPFPETQPPAQTIDIELPQRSPKPLVQLN